ncbi:MAG TPA: MFS transporter, partial [Chlamydiales bacterium]|nr:MFS transporter [Chlamydiales bacterium]
LFANSHTALFFMFLVIALFALLMFIGSLVLPESPRWLMLKGRRTDAMRVIKRTVPTEHEVESELRDIEQTLHSDHHSSIKAVMHKSFVKVLLIGVLLQMFQQLVGINVMIYYTPTIFGYVGMKGLLAQMTVPTVNMLFTFPAIYLVEKWGRKKLLYVGATIMFIAMLSAGIAFQIIGHEMNPQMLSGTLKAVLLSTFIVYIFGFAFSWGPVAWLLCSEIFPIKGREIGMTITTMVNWTFAGLVMRYALSFIEAFGNASLFYVFGVFCILSIVFVAFFVPETKGITLEKLEGQLKR